MRTQKEIQAFLTGWLLEHGSGVVSNEELYLNHKWYGNHRISVTEPDIQPYVVYLSDEKHLIVSYQLTEAALELIRSGK